MTDQPQPRHPLRIWQPDPYGRPGFARTDAPEAGGWIYRIASSGDKADFLFVPNLAIWQQMLGSSGATIERLLVSANLQETLMSKLDDNVTALTSAVTAEQTQVDSAVVLLNGLRQTVADAVAEALAAGATDEQLKPINDAIASIGAQTNALASAVATAQGTTPAEPTVPVTDPTPAAA
jgi:hypothetical protein